MGVDVHRFPCVSGDCRDNWLWYLIGMRVRGELRTVLMRLNVAERVPDFNVLMTALMTVLMRTFTDEYNNKRFILSKCSI